MPETGNEGVEQIGRHVSGPVASGRGVETGYETLQRWKQGQVWDKTPARAARLGRLAWIAWLVHPVERAMQRHLERWHGRGEAHQHEYFRCKGCHRIVTWKAIRKGGCMCGLSHELGPAVLTWWEKLRLLILPWAGVRR